MNTAGVEMSSQTCKHSLKACDQIGHASLMGKAGFILKTSASGKSLFTKNGT